MYQQVAIMKFLILSSLLHLICTGCSSKSENSAYPLIHYDGCTGVCEFIKLNDKKLSIQFSAMSNSKQLELLRALNASIFLANTGTYNNLYVVGKIGETELKDEHSGESYYEFILDSWYLGSPFEENLNFNNTPLDAVISEKKILKRYELKETDFDIQTDQNLISSLKGFVRTKR